MIFKGLGQLSFLALPPGKCTACAIGSSWLDSTHATVLGGYPTVLSSPIFSGRSIFTNGLSSPLGDSHPARGVRPQPVFLTSSVLKFCCHQKSLTIWETFTLPVSSAVLRCSLSWDHSFSVFAQRKYAKKFHLSVAGLLLITADFQSLLTGISCPIEANISLRLCWSFRNHC